MALLALIVGVIVLVAGTRGPGDSKKGLALARTGGVSTPRRADVKTGEVIPREDTAATPR